MKIENQIDLQKFYQISLNQNMYESDDSKTENKIIDIIRFNIDIVFIMWLLYIILQLMLKLWLIKILKFWCFTNYMNNKIWQKIIKNKHMSNKIKYDKKENLIWSHML